MKKCNVNEENLCKKGICCCECEKQEECIIVCNSAFDKHCEDRYE